MAKTCDFCLNKLKANEGFNVKEVVIDKNPGIIKLSDVLLDLFFCELNVSNICPDCMDTVSKQFIFKQKIRKNILMPSSNVIVQVSKFFSKSKETNLHTAEHLNVLSIFPEHRKRFVETVQKFSPEICIMPPTIKEVLPNNSNESVSNKTPINKKETAPSTNSDTETNDSNYGVNKSSRKRKKKSGKVRNSNGTKKQKTNSTDSIKKNQSLKAVKNNRKSSNSTLAIKMTPSSEQNDQEPYSILPD
ncbi:uncharacterized protein [Chironomus tepperi]|uniref:uncharacterized protein isoform X2 n=1 Tax=Chironomus tepperi TaxID=113505 RepID=UPI00391F56FF